MKKIYNDSNFEEIYNLIDDAYNSNEILRKIDDDALSTVFLSYINENFYRITYCEFMEIFERWLDDNF